MPAMVPKTVWLLLATAAAMRKTGDSLVTLDDGDRATAACKNIGHSACKIFKAKKHPSVPRGYKCVAMKNCVDRKQNVVLGPVKSTGYCGSRGLQALNTCVAMKTGASKPSKTLAKSVDKDADVPLPPTKPSASSMKPVEKASPLELSTEDTDIDEPVPPVKSSMPSAPAEEVPASDEDIDEPLPPSKSELSPEEAAPICKYTGSAWCPKGTTNAGEKYRRGKEALCCKIEKKEETLSTPSVPMQPILADTKQEDEDADVPLPPTKPSASSMKPVEKASPLELSTEDTDIDEPVPPVKSSMPSAPAEEVPASDEDKATAACKNIGHSACKNFKAKKHPSVPRGYKCVAMKNCVDRKQNVVLGPVKSTGYCGSRGLQALNTCVAVKK